jgi:hypothetical protein
MGQGMLQEFRTARMVMKVATERYEQLKKDVCKRCRKEYNPFLTDGDIMEMLLSPIPPKEENNV